MTVQELIDILSDYNPDAAIRFSVADDESEDEGERWFCEDGVEACFGEGPGPSDGPDRYTEVTVCLVGKSNYADCG